MGYDKSWELPDPFRREDGSRVATIEEWENQRKHFKRILEEQFYGKMPPRPACVRGEKVEEKSVWDETAVYEKESFQCSCLSPKRRKKTAVHCHPGR